MKLQCTYFLSQKVRQFPMHVWLILKQQITSDVETYLIDTGNRISSTSHVPNSSLAPGVVKINLSKLQIV